MNGIDWTMVAMQSLSLFILVGWIVLAIVAFVRLRRCRMDQVARALWALVIALVPIIGALAFFIVDSGKARHWGSNIP